MKKSYFFKFFVFALVGALAILPSCKDYDDDISHLESEISTLKGMSTDLTAIKADVAAAQTAANNALAKANEALEAAKGTGDAAAVEAAQEAADKAQAKADDVEAKATELEGLIEALEGRIATLEALDSPSKEDLENLDADMKEIVQKFETLVGKRLTSITLEPTFNVHGIPTIKFNTLGFVPQVFEEDHGRYASVTMPVDKAELITIDGGNTIAEYRLSPRYIDKKSIGFPYLESIVSENIELLPILRSVDSDKAFKNSPIAPVEGQDLEITDEGILKLKVTKTIDEFLGSEAELFYSENFYEYQSETGATEMEYFEGIKERFYFASLGIPIAEEYLTEEEKAEGGAVVTSEHYRVEEFLNYNFTIRVFQILL